MAYTKYKDNPNRREPLGGRDHIQHIETGLAAAYEEGLGGIKPEDGVFGVGVRRIIASTDPNHPLEDGDLLVLIDAETFFTDFSQETVGQMPSGWSQPWVTSATWTVEDDASATGGKVLRGVSAAIARNALVWTAIGDAQDMEMVYRWRSSNAPTGSVQGVGRVSGAATTETGIVSGAAPGYSTGVITIAYTSGARWASTVESGIAPTRAANTWIRSRLRVTGTTVQYREWADAETEPTTWPYTSPIDGPLSLGRTGFFIERAGTFDIDWIGVAFDGATAPTTGG